MNITTDPAGMAEALDRAVVRTFEEMAFVETVPLPAGDNDGPFAYTLSIDVLKPISGKIRLFLNQDLRDRIVTDLYSGGTEQALGERSGDDCLLEILNVICGRFLKECFGTSHPCKMDLPRLDFGDPAPEGLPIVTARYSAEGMPVTVQLTSIRYRY